MRDFATEIFLWALPQTPMLGRGLSVPKWRNQKLATLSAKRQGAKRPVTAGMSICSVANQNLFFSRSVSFRVTIGLV